MKYGDDFSGSLSIIFLIAMLASCGGGENTANNDNNDDSGNCSFTGAVSGGLNYSMNYDIADGCGVTLTPDNELITSYAGLQSTPNIKIYHENFQPGLVAENRTAHIVIYMNRTQKWESLAGSCNVNITSNQYDAATKRLKIAGSGSCSGQALPDTNTGASDNVTIEPFTFETAEYQIRN